MIQWSCMHVRSEGKTVQQEAEVKKPSKELVHYEPDSLSPRGLYFEGRVVLRSQFFDVTLRRRRSATYEVAGE